MGKLIDADDMIKSLMDRALYDDESYPILDYEEKMSTVKSFVDSFPTVDAIPVSFIQQEIDRYYKDEAITTTGTLNNWIFRSKRLGLQYLIERWKQEQEKQNEKAEI